MTTAGSETGPDGTLVVSEIAAEVSTTSAGRTAKPDATEVDAAGHQAAAVVTSDVSGAERYQMQMSHIHNRLVFAGDFMHTAARYESEGDSNRSTALVESALLQVRKALEGIAAASFVNDSRKYEARLQRLPRMPGAKGVMKASGERNPDFFPEPINPSDSYLTLEKWHKAWKFCGEHLHLPRKVVSDQQPIGALEIDPEKIWAMINDIGALIGHHMFRLHNEEAVYECMVTLDGVVHCSIHHTVSGPFRLTNDEPLVHHGRVR